MIKTFLKELNADFTNIDEVYNINLANYGLNNIVKTELMFIDLFNFNEVDSVENDNVNKLSEYLINKKKHIEWFDVDFLNYFIKHNVFKLTIEVNKTFSIDEFDFLFSTLEKLANSYYYVYSKLTTDKQMVLKNNLIDNLIILYDSQKLNKYKMLINQLIIEIQPQERILQELNKLYAINFNTQKDIISLLRIQLQNLIQIIEDDLKKGGYIYTYFVSENENTFLDLDRLQQYLTQTRVENTSFLKDLMMKADTIIKYWNNEMNVKPELESDLHLKYYQINTNGILELTTFFNFHAIKVLENSLQLQKSEYSKKIFLQDFNYKRINIHSIASKCSLIINYVTSAYPELKKCLENIENQIIVETKEISSVEKKELHNHIFKDSYFLLFEKYFENKNITENCKTDLSILYQYFKSNNLFNEIIELKQYRIWLNDTYDFNLTELKKVDISNKKNISRINDLINYKDLLK